MEPEKPKRGMLDWLALLLLGGVALYGLSWFVADPWHAIGRTILDYFYDR